MLVASMHPYHPTSLELAAYLPNDRSLQSIIRDFTLMLTFVLILAWTASTRYSQGLNVGDKMTVMWFVLCKQ